MAPPPPPPISRRQLDFFLQAYLTVKEQVENPENGLFDHEDGQTLKKALLGRYKDKDMETRGKSAAK